jgi:hypothetical protein
MAATVVGARNARLTLGTKPVGAPAPRVGRAVATLVLVVVAAAAGAGLRVAVPLLEHDGQPAQQPAPADPASPGLAVGQAVRTSYGSLTVTAAQLDNGLTSEELGGMSHGVSGLVSSGRAEVAVTLTLTNDRGAPLALSPGQFTLVTGKGSTPTSAPVAVAGGTLQVDGSVPAHAGVDARLAFVTATDGSRLWLRYTDPGSAQVVRVPLGRAATIAGAPTGAHAGHGSAGLPVPADGHDDH